MTRAAAPWAAADARQTAGEARARSGLYGFLAAIFETEPTAALLRELRRSEMQTALVAAGVPVADLFPGRDGAVLLDDLAVEFTRLFLGPGRHIAPYASVHLGGEGASLWDAPALWFKHFAEDAGYPVDGDGGDPPDHISIELKLMGALAAAQAEAFEAGDAALAEHLERRQDQFLHEHLGRWVPVFCERVMAEAGHPFYREMARLGRDFVRSETALADAGMAEPPWPPPWDFPEARAAGRAEAP